MRFGDVTLLEIILIKILLIGKKMLMINRVINCYILQLYFSCVYYISVLSDGLWP